MAGEKNTHVAKHAIQFRDEDKNVHEIAPGTEFNPESLGLDTDDLVKRDAIAALAAAPVADETDETTNAEKPAKSGKNK